jgi:iron complex transport system substrate-binding protein
VAPSATEIVFALGAGAQLVGDTRYCDYPEEAKALPKIGGYTDLSIEAIVGLKPDLVIGDRIENIRSTIEKLDSFGIKTVFPAQDTLPQLYEAIKVIGEAIGKKAEGEALSQKLQSQIEAVAALNEGKPRPKVLLIVGWRPIIAVAQGTFLDTLLQYAGGQNVVTNSVSQYPNYDMEAIIRRAPEIIIDASMEDPNADIKARWAAFTDIPAVKNGKVFTAPNNSLLRQGPRLAEGLEALSKLLHP